MRDGGPGEVAGPTAPGWAACRALGLAHARQHARSQRRQNRGPPCTNAPFWPPALPVLQAGERLPVLQRQPATAGTARATAGRVRQGRCLPQAPARQRNRQLTLPLPVWAARQQTRWLPARPAARPRRRCCRPTARPQSARRRRLSLLLLPTRVSLRAAPRLLTGAWRRRRKRRREAGRRQWAAPAASPPFGPRSASQPACGDRQDAWGRAGCGVATCACMRSLHDLRKGSSAGSAGRV